MANVLVAGAGGAIGGHLAKSLIEDGHRVRCVDIKSRHQWWQLHDDAENIKGDLSDFERCRQVTEGMDEVYMLAADMGGMGFIETNKAMCMLSVLVSTNMLRAAQMLGARYFYSSSACVYPGYRQDKENITALKESDAYPADAEDGYGWEKLFSERMCRHFSEDFGAVTRVARYHNVYGPHGSWRGGREKAPAALCRKVIEAGPGGNVEIWGDGWQTRSFMYVDDCVEGTKRIMHGNYSDPLNLGSDYLVSINELLTLIEDIAGYKVNRRYDRTKPQGVRGRNSDNTLLRDKIGWEPKVALSDGLEATFSWIYNRIQLER